MACKLNIARAIAEAHAAHAKRDGWEMIGQWHQTVDKCEVPTAVFAVSVFGDASVQDKWYAQSWVMHIVKTKLPSFVRALVVRHLFADSKSFKAFDAALMLMKDAYDVREMVRDVYNETRWTESAIKWCENENAIKREEKKKRKEQREKDEEE